MSDHHDEVDLRAAHPGDALSALLDGELEPADEAAVRRHLAACEPCRIEFDDVTIVRRTVRGLPAVAAPPGLVDRLVDRQQRSHTRRVAVALVAASLTLVVGLVASAERSGAPAGAGGDSQQVALIDRRVRLFPPTPREAVASEPDDPRWDAGRPGPDVKMPSPAGRSPSGGRDDE
jgi:anti-sigma factor RsiW